MSHENEKQYDPAFPERSEKLTFFGKWSKTFVERYRIVYLIVMMMVLLGVNSYMNMSREIQPEIILPYGYVFTQYPGAAPEEVERLVTEKIENRISDITDIKTISSNSSSGMSQIYIEYEQGVDVKEKNREVSERVNSIIAELPEEADTPVIENFETNNSPIVIINITGNYDFVALKNYGEKIVDRLEQEQSVKEAKLVGGLEREVTVYVDPLKLEQYGLAMDDIQNAVRSANMDIPSGNAVLDDRTFNIRTINSFNAVEDIGNVLISNREGMPLYIKDVARVSDGFKKAETFSRMSEKLGQPEAGTTPSISISVKKKANADIINTSKLVREVVETEKGELYPEDLSIQFSGDMAEMVDDSLGAVTGNALSGLVLVLVVLYLFIGLAESIIVATVIPLSILCTLWLMKMADLTINTITLFSMVLAVGMLVDNGIVIMENIDRLRHKGYNVKEAAVIGNNQVAAAVFASMLTTVAAFVPIMLTSGIMGAFIKSIPMTVIFALVSSFLVAITVTPALCTIVLKNDISVKKIVTPKRQFLNHVFSVVVVFGLGAVAFMEDGRFGLVSAVFGVVFALIMVAKIKLQHKRLEESAMIQGYGRILEGIVRDRKKRAVTLIAVFVTFFLSLSLLATGLLKVEMFGNENQDRLYVTISTPRGTPVERTDIIVAEVEQKLLSIKGIESFVANVGYQGADSFEDFGSSSASNPTYGKITLDLVKKDDRDITSMEIADDIRAKVKDIAGATISVEELASGPPTSKAIVIEVKGDSLDALKSVTQDFERSLKDVAGVENVGSSVSQGEAELKITIDRARIKRFGVNEAQVGLAVRNAVEGIKATSYKADDEDVDVVIRTFKDKEVKSVEDIRNIAVQSMSGQMVKVGDVADVTMEEGLRGISREDLTRRMYVQSDLLDGYNAVEVSNTFKEAMKDYVLPEGVTVNYAGEVEDVQETFTEMFVNMLVAVVLVFLILAVQFNSLSQPFIILFTVPMTIIGVLPGLLLTGNSFGFVAFIGVVALVGIAVNDAIVLVDYANYLRREGKELMDAVVETGKSRFIPVMATTITTAGGILPLSIQEEFFQPLGVALIFGLCTASVLTLVIIPVLYVMFESRKMKIESKKELKKEASNELKLEMKLEVTHEE